MEKTRSQMLAIPADGSDIERPQLLVRRLQEAEGFRVESVEPEDNVVKLTIVCEEERFSVEMYPTDFGIPELYRCQHFFPDIDIETIQKIEYGLAVEMEFAISIRPRLCRMRRGRAAYGSTPTA